MTVQVIAEGTRKARKAHQCFHCYRDIGVGETYGFQTNKYDYVYTIKWHLDCEELAAEYRGAGDFQSDEGWGPLRDQLCDAGEYTSMIAEYRGHYPHVIARMELTDQLREVTQ